MAIDTDEFRRRVRFILKLGRALHDCGTTSQRIERHLMNVTRMLHLNGSFLISPTTFTCAFWQDDELDQFIHIERLEPADHDLGRLWEIDRLVENIAEERISLQDGIILLAALTDSAQNYSPRANAFSWALIGGSFAALLSSNPQDCLAAASLSLILYFLTQLTTRHPRWEPVVTILAPFISGLLASAAAVLGLAINVPFVILSSIIIFIPGLALTMALTEISARHLISGSSRLVDATMLLVKLFVGALGGMAIADFLLGRAAGTIAFLAPLPDWKTWPALAGLSLGLGIAFNIPPRKIPWGLLAAAIAFIAASLGESCFGMYTGMFIGALAVGLYGNLFSKITRGPGSILMTQGLVLLVPGSKTYMILDHWVSGKNILPIASTSHQALIIFFSLLAGLLFANALLPTDKSL